MWELVETFSKVQERAQYIYFSIKGRAVVKEQALSERFRREGCWRQVGGIYPFDSILSLAVVVYQHVLIRHVGIL